MKTCSFNFLSIIQLMAEDWMRSKKEKRKQMKLDKEMITKI